MPEIWMDVDVALAEVPVNKVPLIDDTDFKSKEESVAYNAAGMDLVWNFVTAAGAFTQTAVTPTTAGDYDWTNQGNGMYTIEIPASGGASINNNTEGFGWFTGFATGILPWTGPIIGFRAAGLNGLLIEDAYSATRGLAGTALPAAAADAAGGLPISDAGGLNLDGINTNITTLLNRIGAFTGTGVNTVLGFFLAMMRSDATTPSDVGGTYDDATDSLEALRDRGDAAWTTGGGGSITDILNVIPLVPPEIDLADTATWRLGLMLTNAVDDLPSTAEITPGTISIDRKAYGATSWSAVVTDAACSEIAGQVYYDEVFDSGTGYAEGDSIRITFKSQKITVAANDYEVAGTTGRIFYTSIARSQVDLVNAPNATALNAIADALLTRDWTSVTGEAARSVLNALRFLRNKWSISGSTLTVTEEDDTTSAWTSTLTTNASADPIDSSDPT